MGYRSDIVLCLSKSASAKLNDELTGLMNEVKSITPETCNLDNADECIAQAHQILHNLKIIKMFDNADKKMKKSAGDKLFCWYSVKWYDDVPGVIFLREFLRELNSEDFLYIIVGEDAGDVTIEGAFWNNSFNIQVETNVRFS